MVRRNIAVLEADDIQNIYIQKVNEIKTIDEEIKLAQKQISSQPPAGYSHSWSWREKATFAINMLNKPCNIREILDYLFPFDPIAEDGVGPLTSSLKQAFDKGQIERRIRESGEFEYFFKPKVTEGYVLTQIQEMAKEAKRKNEEVLQVAKGIGLIKEKK